MIRFILRLLGWAFFPCGKVSIFQRGCLVNQEVIVSALEDTKKKRLWCDDSRLNIFIEPQQFRGIYGAIQSVEVARFEGLFAGRRSANIRIAASSLTYDNVVGAVMEINRDNKKRD